MKNTKIKKTIFFFTILFAILLNSSTFAGTGFGISPDTIVNTLGPAPSNVFVLINDGDTSTLSPDVTITNLTYGAAWVDIADNQSFSPCETNTYASSFGYVLPKAGTNIVYLRYRNIIGNTFVTNLWIFFDQAPSNVFVLINDGDTSTLSPNVIITNLTYGADYVDIADNQSFSECETKDYAPSFGYVLPKAGTNTVYLRYRNIIGNTFVTNLWIFFDQAPSNVFVLINDGDTSTLSPDVTITNLTYGADYVDIADNQSFSACETKDYAPSFGYVLPKAGTNTVYLRYRNIIGNTFVTNLWIFFDQAPSNVFVLINDGETSTLSPDVIITNLTYGADYVDIADNQSFSPCETNTYASSFGYVLPKRGTNTVYLRYRNNIGNTFVTNLWIFFDQAPSNVFVLINDGDTSTLSPDVIITNLTYGADYVDIADNQSFSACETKDYAPSFGYVLPKAGTNTVYLRYRNIIGNTFVTNLWIVFDQALSNVFVLINDGDTSTLSPNVTITNLTYGAAYVDIADNQTFSPCETNTYAPSFGYVLPKRGTNTVYLRYRNNIGNTFVTNLWIVFDQALSNVFVLINDGATSTLSPNVIITNLTYGAAWVDVADNQTFSPCETNTYAPSFGYVLPKAGTNIVYLRYRNNIGNTFVTNLWIFFDRKPSTPPILVSPADSSYWGHLTVVLEWKNGIGTNEINGVEIEFNSNTISLEVTNKHKYGVAPNSINTWRVRTFDIYGIASSWSETWQFTVDVSVPIVNLLSPDSGIITNSPPQLQWSIDNDPLVASNTVIIDGVEYYAGTETTLTVPVDEGVHAWQVKSVNFLGKVGTSNFRYFTYDTTPPQIVFASGITSNVFVQGVNTVRIDFIDTLSGIDWNVSPKVKLTVGTWPAAKVYKLNHSTNQWIGQIYLSHYFGEGFSDLIIGNIKDLAGNIIISTNITDAIMRMTADGNCDISGGTFSMGSMTKPDEQPIHQVTIDAFSIDRYEVANEVFAQFIQAGGYTNSAYWSTEGWIWKTANNISAPARWDTTNEKMWESDHFSSECNSPVVGVSWYEAVAFATWVKRQLPTEAEWEYVAQKPHDHIYAWGNDFWLGQTQPNYTLANWQLGYNGYTRSGYTTDGAEFLATENSYPAGATTDGVLNMLGNAKEWVHDWYADTYQTNVTLNPFGPPTGTLKVLRGEGFMSSINQVRNANRSTLLPESHGYDSGFRTSSIPEPFLFINCYLLFIIYKLKKNVLRTLS